jgi:hypothetical protein
MKSMRSLSLLMCSLAVALTGCAFEGADASGDGSTEVGASDETLGETSQALTKPFKIKARRAEICLRASWQGDPVGGNLIGVQCGTEADFYFMHDEAGRIVTSTGHCVGITNDGPSGMLVIQNCDGDKDQRWTFRPQTERKVDAWHTKYIQFIENDNPGYFLRLPNQTPNTAATSSGWSRSFYRDYDWLQEYVQ